MRIKRGNWKTLLIALAIIGVLTVCSLAFGWSSARSAVRVGYVGNDTPGKWNGTYHSLHGTMKKNMKPKSDLLVLEFTTENGSLSVQVLDDHKNVVLEQAQVGNQTLQLPVDGRVTVILTADHHKGSFSIRSE